MPANDDPILDADHAAFVQSGVSIAIGASTRDAIPAHVRALGCRVSSDRRRLTVFVPVSQAGPVLERIRENRAIAVVFSNPPTHRTMQLKGRDAQEVPLENGDLEIVDAYRAAFAHALVPLGFEEAAVHTLLMCPPSDIVGISLTPTEAYSQTPGPKAGAPLARSQ